MAGRVAYEVQIYDKGHWAINELMPSEESARQKAKDLLALKHIVGVRIVKESHFASDSRRETEIFKEMKQAEKDDDLSVQPIDSAPVCDRITDYYKTAARVTIGRLFSKYVEKFELTPLELLHSASNLKRIINLDTLVPSAVDKVAALQARTTGEDTRKRREVLFAAIDTLAKRAREAEGKPVAELKGSTLDAVLARIDAKVADPDERQFLANMALVKVSLNWQGWIGKISGLLPLARSEQDERSLAMVDEMMADILMARTVIKDVIGISKHMGDGIMRVLDLIHGKCVPTKFAAVELVSLLNTLFAEDKLPRSKAALFDRVARDLKGPVRLTSSEEIGPDKDFFVTLLDRLVTDHGVIGGSLIANGLAERWARMNNVGGVTGRKKAIEGICGLVKSGKHKFVYLLSLYDNKAEAEVRGSIEVHIRALVQQFDTIRKVAPEARTEKTRLQETAAIQRLVLDSLLEDRFKIPLANAFDALVSEYIISENVIQRLDDSKLSFRDRALRLVSFASSGVLTVGKATAITRDAVVNYLRRKDFITEFTDGIADPADKEKAIKDFYTLLARTGFDMKG
ncbi:MAG: hypothetical protein EPO08_09040 [Rhodospirillaceae bacterium]|nr:MAG: hypothetical protein EPO08_09040 [Rhodospirillaceae bacterium]